MKYERPTLEEPSVKKEVYDTPRKNNTEVARFTLTDLASYHRPTTGGSPFCDNEEPTAGSNKYFPHNLKGMNFDGRVQETKNWVFPHELKQLTLVQSSMLYEVMEQNTAPKVNRRQERGRFDMGAMPRVIKDIHKGDFSPENTRPFTNRTRKNPEVPSVGIVVQGNWGFMWDDDDNIPNVVAAALAVSWACEAVGCLVDASLMRNLCAAEDRLGIYDLIVDGVSCPLSDYAPCFHRDMFRWASCTINLAHEEHHRLFGGRTNGSESADGEFYGVKYMREVRGHDMVIVLGTCADASGADIQIEDVGEIKKLIPKIAKGIAAISEGRKAA